MKKNTPNIEKAISVNAMLAPVKDMFLKNLSAASVEGTTFPEGKSRE